MRHYFRAAALFLVTFILPAASDPHWIHMRSDHFEIYSTAGEKDTRETLRYFEQVRGFFVEAMHSAPNNELPVVIVGFGSKKEFEPYRFNEFASAYYHGTSRCDYIVLSQVGYDTFPVATHEYVHLFVRHAGLKLPPWLNEGLAEFYSTLKPFSGKILVGGLVEARRQALLRDKWVPLSVILAADHDSPYYNEKNKAGNLYNEGWALTHMLILSKEYRPGFAKAVAAIVNGQLSEAVLTTIYGKPLTAIEKDLQSYMRGDRFQGALFPLQLDKANEELHGESAAMFDVSLALAELLDRPGNEETARKRYEALSAENSQRPEPFVELGFLASRRHDNEEARDHFAKAYALGAREPEMLWHYGLLIQRSNMPESIAALTELLRQQPDRVDVRLALAGVQLASHKPEDAVKTLTPVHKVTPDQAPSFFSRLAHAQQQSGDLKLAKENAKRLLEVSRTPGERDDADRLIAYLDAVGSQGTPTPLDTAAPALARGDQSPVQSPIRPPAPPTRLSIPLSRLRGTFAELDCSSAQPRVIVDVEGKKKILLIDKPDSINLGKATMEFTCGRQKPATVEIAFIAPGADHPGVDGLLREIHYAQ